MESGKKSRNPLHGVFDRFKGKKRPVISGQLASRETKPSVNHDQSVTAKEAPLQHVQDDDQEILKTDKQKSFWEQAAERLDPELRQTLDDVRNTPLLVHSNNGKGSKDARNIPALPEMVTREAQRRLEDMEHRQWALTVGVAGKTIEVRTILGDFLKFAKFVKDKGDAFIELDTTGYAKLAWLPFSLFVDLTTTNIEQHHAALDAFSKISFLIYRYAEIEKIYHERKQKEEKFENCLVDLYEAVLQCEVALIHHFSRHGFLRFLRAIPAIDGWQDRMTTINDLDSDCQSLVDIHVTKDILDLRHNVDELVETKRRKEINEILDWITDHDSFLNRKKFLEKLGTSYLNVGKWLIEHEKFSLWLESDHEEKSSQSSQYGVQLLWLHGPVGCGKSSLTTRAIEHLLERNGASKHEDEQLSYFYCTKTHGSGSKPLDIFQSIVRQLAWSPKESQIAEIIQDTWRSRKSPNSNRLSDDECQNILLHLIQRCQMTTLFIDALDECDNPQEFLEALRDLSASAREKELSVRVFISSRDEVNHSINTIFPDCLSINITSDSTDSDLRHFIERRVERERQRYSLVREDDYFDTFRRLVDELAERGQLAFRWTELQLALFFPSGRPFNPEALEERLQGLNQRLGLDDLDNTYKEIYKSNIDDTSARKKDLDLALKWILASDGPVHIILLVDTIKLNHKQRDSRPTSWIDLNYILNVASNLLVVDDHGTVHFAHISVKEYLQLSADFNGEFSDMEANEQVTESCLQYLLLSYREYPKYTAFRIMYNRDEDALFYYSLTRWAVHWTKRKEKPTGKHCCDVYFAKLVSEASNGEEFSAWVRACDGWFGFNIAHIKDSVSTPPNPFFLACIWGFRETLDKEIRRTPEVIRAMNKEGKNGLHLAAYYGQLDVIEALLEFDVDINLITDNEKQQTALQQAVIGGHAAIAKMLLQRRKDFDIDAQDAQGYTAIHHAVERGYIEITRILLDERKDLDINEATYAPIEASWDEYQRGLTPLHLAILKGHHDVVKVLLANREDIDIKIESIKGTPFHLVASEGSVEIVDILFEERKDIDINLKSYYGRTALHLAAWNGHDLVVRALLAHGAIQVNAIDEIGSTPLHYAAGSGNVQVIQTLIEECDDLDINLRDFQGCTALHLAARSGHYMVIETLLCRCEDINVNTQDKIQGRTALHLAIEGGHAEAIASLLSNSTDLDTEIRDGEGRAALHLASENWNPDIIRALLDGCENLNINITNKEGQTALHLAIKNGHMAVLEELLKCRAIDLNIEDINGQTALHLAASQGSVRMLEALVLGYGHIKINARDKTQSTALHLTCDYRTFWASNRYPTTRGMWLENSMACIRILLENGIDITYRDKSGRAALYIAFDNNHSEAVRAIIEKGSNLLGFNEDNKNVSTLLYQAVVKNDRIVIETLFEKWPDSISLANNLAIEDGSTLLHMAVAKWRSEIVSILLTRCPPINVYAVDNEGWTILHAAAQHRDTLVIHEIIKKYPDMSTAPDKKGRTALHIAASKGYTKPVQILLDCCPFIDVNAVDNAKGYTALHYAVERNSSKTVQALLDTRPDIDVNIADHIGRTAIQVAAFARAENSVQILLDKRTDCSLNHKDYERKTVLHLAAEAQRSTVPLTLLKKREGFHINATDTVGRTALHLLIEYAQLHKVRRKWRNEVDHVVGVLFEKYRDTVDINACDNYGRTVSHVAAEYGRLDVLRAIMQTFSDVDLDIADMNGRTVLHLAAYHRSIEETSPFLNMPEQMAVSDDCWEDHDSDATEESETSSDESESSSDESFMEDDWNEPKKQSAKLVNLILAKCSDVTVNAKDKQGLATLHIAAFAPESSTVEELLSGKRDVDANARDQHGWTALHIAAFWRSLKVVEALFMNGSTVDPNSQDHMGRTPLHLAASRGHSRVVEALLQRGRNVDLTLRDIKGQTPLDTAVEREQSQVIELLRAAQEQNV